MRQLIREILQVLAAIVSAGLISAGLVWIHPGLGFVALGGAGMFLSVRWIRRDRAVPGVPPGFEQRDFRDPPEEDPNDDGRMEVRPI